MMTRPWDRLLGRRDEPAPLRRPDAPMVLADGVRKSFGENEVLRGVDLCVERGEVVCIIGPSGSGKSTLLRCINHLERLSLIHI